MAAPATGNPEIGRTITAGGLATNYHDLGQGFPAVFIHGSGPGVSAWANWRLNLPVIAEGVRAIAPDMAGFGFTEHPAVNAYDMDLWIGHLLGLLDALELTQVDLVGNSYGGSLALQFAIRHPRRVRRMVLMGAVSLPFDLTSGLDATWGYEPSIENMRRLLDLFAYDRSLVSDELAELRYRAASREGVQEAFSAMFPAPRQRWVDHLASAEEDIRALDHEMLIIHGREDLIIPVGVSQALFALTDRSQLHLFGRCGHWTQIEHAGRFNRLVGDFLTEEQPGG